MSFVLRQGDDLEPLIIVPKDATGAVPDLSAATATFRMGRDGTGGTNKVNDAAAEIVPDVVIGGQTYAWGLKYAWASGDVDTAGNFIGRFRTTIGGKKQSWPNSSNIAIQIIADVP